MPLAATRLHGTPSVLLTFEGASNMLKYISSISWIPWFSQTGRTALTPILAVFLSPDTGFIGKDHFILNNDCSSLHINASGYDRHVLDDNEADPVFTSVLLTLISACTACPSGRDSDLNFFYPGFTFCNISCHNLLRNIYLHFLVYVPWFRLWQPAHIPIFSS